MRRLAHAATVLAVLGLAAGGVGAATASSGGADITTAQRLHFDAVTTSFHFADVNRNHRPDPAETFALVDSLSQHGAKAGANYIACTVVTAARIQCTFTLELAGGKISGNSSVPADTRPGSSFTVAITGGTGRYANVRGDATITQGRGNHSTYDVRLLP